MNSEERSSGNIIQATVSGPTNGQVAIGNGNIQIGAISGGQVAVATGNIQQVNAARPAVTEAELADLKQAFAALKAQVEAQAAPDKKQPALDRVDELEEAITAREPDLGTLGYVKRWFARNLPQLAGAVTGVIIHPIVGKLVEAAGDALAAEFRRMIGQPD